MGTTYGYINGKRVNEATITHMMGTKIVESTGPCKWSRKCKNYDGVLGNGLCMDCWDNGGRLKRIMQSNNIFQEFVEIITNRLRT